MQRVKEIFVFLSRILLLNVNIFCQLSHTGWKLWITYIAFICIHITKLRTSSKFCEFEFQVILIRVNQSREGTESAWNFWANRSQLLAASFQWEQIIPVFISPPAIE